MNAFKHTQWSFYLGWIFSGLVSLFVTFPLAWVLSVFVIDQIVGQTILVGGEMRITEDNVLRYAFIPWYGIAIGVLQYLLLRQKLAKMGGWILTTTLGWSLLWLCIGLRYNPLGNMEIPSPAGYFLIAGTGIGALIGVMQWSMLRRQVSHAIWWIPINGLGFGMAGLLFADLSSVLEAIAAFTIPCICTGIVLWLWLEKFPRDVNHGPSAVSVS